MRMPIALSTLLAVVCGAVASAGDLLLNVSRVRRAPHRIMTDEDSWKRTYWREMQSILRQPTLEDKSYVECCPSIKEMVAPKGGKSQSGLFTELYEDGENKQQLYEISCAPGVVDRPCRFIDARLYNQSKCVQKYSFSYALVRNLVVSGDHRPRKDGHVSVPGSGDWSLDYVQVRSGCECQITPPQKRRSAHKKAGVTKRPERHRARKKIRRFEEFGET